jgi:hypothetical protein
MLTQLKQFYYFYETEVTEMINVKRNDNTDTTTSYCDDLHITEID